MRSSFDSRMEGFRSRLLYKLLDAALTAPLQPRQTASAHIKTIARPRSSNYKRVAAAINLVDGVVPGISRRISGSLCMTDRLPLSYRNLRLLSYGSGSTVFSLDTNVGPYVLKVYRRSLGKRGSSLYEITQEFQQKYRRVVGWFNREFNIVPASQFLMLQGPLLGKPAAAVLQPFMTGEKKDFFLDFSDEDLVRLLETHIILKGQFSVFVKQILHLYNEEGLCIDFIGRENLLLLKNETGYHLHLIDNGIFDLKKMKASDPALFSEIEHRIARLTYLAECLSGSTVDEV